MRRRRYKESSATNTFAGRVYAERKKRKLTQQRLADAVGVSRISIVNWENPRQPVQPQVAVMGRLCDFLGVEPGYLMYGSGETAAKPVAPQHGSHQFEEALIAVRGARWSPTEAAALKALIDVGTTKP